MSPDPPDPSLLRAYDYELPPELIAQTPPPRREEARLLVVERSGSAPLRADERFPALLDRLREGDCLILNDARVFPARVRFRRPGGGDAELFLLEPRATFEAAGGAAHGAPVDPAWEALIRPARWARRFVASRDAIALTAPPSRPTRGAAALRVEEELGEGRFAVVIERDGRALEPRAVLDACREWGEVPLPPYIRRAPGDAHAALDRERYQTTYATAPWAVAAPTAGLHFTPALIAAARERGVEVLTLTHQVGIGTFRPLPGERLEEGARLHGEWSRIDAACAERLRAPRHDGRRIVAVGTTTVRALESFALAGRPAPYHARTDLFIRPGHRFALVDAMVTNFHLPRSSLLVLVSAFAGRERVLAAYRFAVRARFRFYSYGDAMLIL